MIFLQFLGAGGKIGINCFLLVSGYFMVKQKAKVMKFVKLYFEIKFYKLIFFIIFVICGYEVLSLKSIILNIFNLAHFMGSESFSSLFVGLFLLIPFINKLVENLNEKQILKLICILICLHTISSTFFFASCENLTWYITVYLIGAYIRLYPKNVYRKKHFWSYCSLSLMLSAYLSIIIVDFIGSRIGFTNYYHMVAGADKLLALSIAISLFFLFFNIRMEYHKMINIVSSATFGVLLIHANSDAMRTFLWNDVFNVSVQYNDSFAHLVLHAVVTILIVYISCVLIDLIRIYVFEKPLFKVLRKKYPALFNMSLYNM